MGCIQCSLVLCAWTIHPADISSRLSVDLTLILTAVAFKSILAAMLPKVSYMTPLDSYVMAGFCFLTGVTTCHALLPVFFLSKISNSDLHLPPVVLSGEQVVIDADMIAFYVFACG